MRWAPILYRSLALSVAAAAALSCNRGPTPATAGPTTATAAAADDPMPEHLAPMLDDGIKICTGELSAHRALGRRVRKICVEDTHGDSRLWLEELAEPSGGEAGAEAAETIVEVALPGRPRRRVDDRGGLHYELVVDLSDHPPEDELLGPLAQQFEQVRFDLRLSLRRDIRTEGALSQHFIGQLTRVDTPIGGEPLEPKIINGLHFYSIDHDPDIHWSYHGKTSPDFWGDLEGANEACAPERVGGRQSPIFLSKESLGTPDAACPGGEGLTQIHYRASHISLVNNGHTVQASVHAPGELTDPEMASYIVADGKRYDLLQFHFHTPSEHLVDDALSNASGAYPLEMHLVHRSADGELAVLGVFAEQSGKCEASDLIHDLLDQFPVGLNNPREYSGTINPGALLPPANRREVFAYSGSLTTPPCSEPVHWYVMRWPISVTSQELAQITGVLEEPNARRHPAFVPPVPPLNDRPVRLCPGPRGTPVR